MYPPNQTPPDNLPPATEQPPAGIAWPPQQGQAGVAWPPPQGQAGVVWPPPPVVTDASQGPVISVPFKEEYRRVEGNVSDFRIGTVTLYPQGIVLQGVMALRAEIQAPIIVVTFLLSWILALIAYLIMEYGCRRQGYLPFEWSQVSRVVVAPKKQRICLVFRAPNQGGTVKTFSLAFRLDQATFASFVEAARSAASEKVVEGRIPSAVSPIVVFFVGLLALVLTVAVIALIATGGAHGH